LGRTEADRKITKRAVVVDAEKKEKERKRKRKTLLGEKKEVSLKRV
jgi:hypothetical protein